MWDLMHPKVKELAKTRFENKNYADSVSVCIREINTILKEFVRAQIKQELDGVRLIERAFVGDEPIIALADLTTEDGRNIQNGYKKIFEGAFLGIRNPKAHTNLYPSENKTIHLLFICSFMFVKLEEAGVPITIKKN